MIFARVRATGRHEWLVLAQLVHMHTSAARRSSNTHVWIAEPRSMVQGKLNTYNYFDNVWQFDVSDVTFKLTPRAQGSLAHAPRITADKLKIICVDAKLCQAAP